MSQPLLKSHARVLRRDPQSLQIGLVAGDGVVLSGLSPTEMAQVSRLATRAPRSDDETPTRLGEIVATLRGHGLVTDAPTAPRDLRDLGTARVASFAPDASARSWAYRAPDDGFSLLARRAAAHVVVDGLGRLPEDVAACLRDGGIGRLTTGGPALTEFEERLRAGTAVPPDVVVLVGDGGVPFQRGEPWARLGVPHLPVVVDGPRVEVGPLARDLGPCLRCLDLHRTDRDPAWPTILAQLVARLDDVEVHAESALRRVAAGLVGLFVHAVLDGASLPPGLALSSELPVPSVHHHQWQPHPRCACRRPG